MIKYQEPAALSGPGQQQTVIEEMKVDWTSSHFPSQAWGDTGLKGRQLPTLHQPSRL